MAGLYGMFSFIRNCQSTKATIQFASLTAVNGCLCCSNPFTNIWGQFFFSSLFCDSNRSVVASHCYFNLQLPDDIRWWAFLMPICHLFIFSREVFAQIFCPIFNWIDYFFFYHWVLRVLCVFWIQALHQIYVCKYFSQSVTHSSFF